MYGINSFIDAVARAIGNIGLKTFIMKDKHIFQKLGKKMASDPYIGLSRQETYDLNIEVVKKWIKSDQYFDPKRFLKIVEDYF